MDSLQTKSTGFIDQILNVLKKNYQIISIRIRIEILDRKRNRKYLILGRRLYKLIVEKRIELPEQKKLMDSIEEINAAINQNSEELLNLIQK
ncbi:MAG: hypothetical protein A2161_04285 [Candidatus Schekmanbacteria bacterium RBG_13_48_7]|uniref:Uncharacterized protein n=1 Tax=Candidatus Schekmanbacteria bacterium RBG_13_48_7 TaxID=1817878 RepID=A0A1F7RP59_9BACT|nr:MAG: hypothetical protein A2161_04285 [Candidatus Schekmanbacteria bacterium RBG_13_48_7]